MFICRQQHRSVFVVNETYDQDRRGCNSIRLFSSKLGTFNEVDGRHSPQIIFPGRATIIVAEQLDFHLNTSGGRPNVGRATKQNPYEETRLWLTNVREEGSEAPYSEN